jgi:hypothetical protein
MFIRIKSTPYSPRKSVQIVASRREGGKIKQQILRHVGVADDEQELQKLRELAGVLLGQLKREESLQLLLAPVAVGKPLKRQDASLKVDLRHLHELQRRITGIHEVYGKLYEELGFGRVLAKPSAHVGAVRLLKQLVMARLAAPLSKRGSVRDLNERFGIRLSLPAVYRMLDRVDEAAQDRLRQLARCSAEELFGQKIHLIFYDCTTLYFESFEEDALRAKGFSKDNLFSQTQVVLALAVTREGVPLGYELFPGNMYEGHTFGELIRRIKSNWKPSELVVVADSAMLSEANLAMLQENGYSYIVGARLKSLKGTLAREVLSLAVPVNPDDKPGEDSRQASAGSIAVDQYSRLVVSFSPLRARKDAHEREKMIERLRRKLGKSAAVKPVLGKQGYRRFLDLDGDCQVKVDESAIQKAAAWDGLHGVRTNLLKMSEADVLEQYRGLWQVEDCFRVSKHDLRVRPIYHWTESRIRAHVAICFMALCCVRHLMYRVKLQQGAMSAEAIRRALLSVQVSEYRDDSTGRIYELPGRWQVEAERLYRTMGLSLRATARRVEEKEVGGRR